MTLPTIPEATPLVVSSPIKRHILVACEIY
jgi:hypothetical protein